MGSLSEMIAEALAASQRSRYMDDQNRARKWGAIGQGISDFGGILGDWQTRKREAARLEATTGKLNDIFEQMQSTPAEYTGDMPITLGATQVPVPMIEPETPGISTNEAIGEVLPLYGGKTTPGKTETDMLHGVLSMLQAQGLEGMQQTGAFGRTKFQQDQSGNRQKTGIAATHGEKEADRLLKEQTDEANRKSREDIAGKREIGSTKRTNAQIAAANARATGGISDDSLTDQIESVVRDIPIGKLATQAQWDQMQVLLKGFKDKSKRSLVGSEISAYKPEAKMKGLK
jgi:hypothetical protein